MISKDKKRVIVTLKKDTVAYLESVKKVQHLSTFSQALELALAVDNPFDLIDYDYLQSIIK